MSYTGVNAFVHKVFTKCEVSGGLEVVVEV